jgi:tripartite-type tricarboxylate transporter receptor subunit TctC
MKQFPSHGELTRRSLLAGGAGVLLTWGEARGQSFPSGPVKIVTSVGPGAAPDIISRMVAEHLTRLWGQQVIVFNQPGGAGAVAIKAVAPAAPDGHTLYMALASNFVALPELQKNFPVDLVRDFMPIGFVGLQRWGSRSRPRSASTRCPS